jgi:two-component system chemotaxis sensor kinase CheA
MDGMGELLVARMRTEQRLADLRALQQRLTRWEKSWRQARAYFTRLQRQNGPAVEMSRQSIDSAWDRQTDYASQAIGFRRPEKLATVQARDIALRQAQDVAPLLDFLALNEKHLKALSAEADSLLRSFSSDYRRLALLTDDLQDSVRRVRMLPIATLFDIFPRMVRDLARERDKEVTLQIEGVETEVDRQVLEMMKDPLIHLLRQHHRPGSD